MSLSFEAVPPRLRTRDGAVELRTGFSVLGANAGRDAHHWQNLVTHLPVGERLRVQLRSMHFGNQWDGYQDFLEYEIPLPAGTALVPGSIRDAYLDWHVADGRLLLRQSRPGIVNTSFELIGTTPGTFRVPPARSWSSLRPDDVQRGYPTELTVLPLGEASPDSYRATPDELFDRGTRHYEAGDLDDAMAALGPLYERFQGLFDDRTEAKLAEMMLTLSIRAGDAARTVVFFESLTEHDPAHFLTLDEVVAIGRAYRDLGEHERAARLFQATLAESFGTDLRLAGALDRFGDLAGSLDLLDRLWREYPDLPAVITGDVLFVGSCGGVNYAGSDARLAFESLQRRLGSLPGESRLYPGHDYGKTPTSTLEWEFANNPALTADTLEAFCAYKKVPVPT